MGLALTSIYFGIILILFLIVNLVLVEGEEFSTFELIYSIAALTSPYWLYRLVKVAFRLLIRAYEQKYLSDWMMKADVIFIIFLGWHISLILASDQGYWYAPAAVLLFLGYKIFTQAGFKWIGGKAYGMEIVVLRVFGFRKRTEQLLENFSSFWRFIDPIHLIASSDVTNLTVEPHELYYFLKNKGTTDQFIKTQEELEIALSRKDITPDPDGRYRINEFFCYKNTWRQAVQRILHESEAVLMDLRTFSEQKQGCLYEIGLLFQLVPLRQIIFVVDRSTDMNFLKSTMKKIWAELQSDSVNYQNGTNTVYFFETAFIEVNPIQLYQVEQSFTQTLFRWPKHLYDRIFFNRSKELERLTNTLYLQVNKR